MLHGRFGESSGRPYIPARVFIPRLGLAGNVSFGGYPRRNIRPARFPVGRPSSMNTRPFTMVRS